MAILDSVGVSWLASLQQPRVLMLFITKQSVCEESVFSAHLVIRVTQLFIIMMYPGVIWCKMNVHVVTWTVNQSKRRRVNFIEVWNSALPLDQDTVNTEGDEKADLLKNCLRDCHNELLRESRRLILLSAERKPINCFHRSKKGEWVNLHWKLISFLKCASRGA